MSNINSFVTDSEREQAMGACMKATVGKDYNHRLIMKLYAMKNLKRFNGSYMIKEDMLSNHCFSVGNLFYEVSKAEDIPITIEELMWVFRHDVFETLTGDVLRPAKEYNADVKSKWEDIEHILFEQAEFSYMNMYTDGWAEQNMSATTLQLFKECDILDILYVAKYEVLMGNAMFRILMDKMVSILKTSTFATIRQLAEWSRCEMSKCK